MAWCVHCSLGSLWPVFNALTLTLLGKHWHCTGPTNEPPPRRPLPCPGPLAPSLRRDTIQLKTTSSCGSWASHGSCRGPARRSQEEPVFCTGADCTTVQTVLRVNSSADVTTTAWTDGRNTYPGFSEYTSFVVVTSGTLSEWRKTHDTRMPLLLSSLFA